MPRGSSSTSGSDGRTVSVSDNGRGIPVDTIAKTGKSALEVIFTTLHAGGKFDNDAYKVAGGLHGVGASVVNALSKSLRAEVRRDGWTYTQSFRRGKPLGGVERGEPARGTGTTVTFTPDPEIFRDQSYDADAHRRAPGREDVPEQGARRSSSSTRRRRPPPSSATTAAWPTSSPPSTRPARTSASRRSRSSWNATTTTCVWPSLWAGPRPPTRRSARSSTPSPPATAAPTSRACARPSARPCASSWTRTTSSRRGWRSRRRTSARASPPSSPSASTSPSSRARRRTG